MFHVNDLIDAVKRDDAVTFLYVYLSLIAAKVSLSLPVQNEFELVKSEWLQIIPAKCPQGSDRFYVVLTNVWLELVASHGGPISDNFVNELITLLMHHKKNKSLKSIVNEGPKVGMTPNLAEVTPSISDEYALEMEVRNQKRLSVNALREKSLLFLKQQKEKHFISYIIELALLDPKIQLPQSSVIPSIEKQWSDLILKEFSKKVSQRFLSKLATLWFHFVNKYGIPFSVEEKESFMVHFRKKFHSDLKLKKRNNVPKKSVQNKGFLSKLFGL